MIVVPIQQNDEGLTVGDDDEKADADHMTEIINEVNVEPEAPADVAKPKAKRAPKKNKCS